MMGIIWCSPAILAALSRHATEPVQAVLYSETAHQWSRINPGHPLTKNREGKERWPDQEAISKKQLSAMLRSQEPTVAFMLPKHISTLVYPTPACSLPYPSKELEFQRRKPPDHGGERWPAEVISTKNNASIRCSLLYDAVLVLPIPLASSGRIINTRHRNDELVWRVRKPPNITGRRLLLEAVNKIKGGRERAHLPVFRPTSAPYARSPASWLTFILLAWNCFHMALASIIHCYLGEVPVILHANGKSWL